MSLDGSRRRRSPRTHQAADELKLIVGEVIVPPIIEEVTGEDRNPVSEMHQEVNTVGTACTPLVGDLPQHIVVHGGSGGDGWPGLPNGTGGNSGTGEGPCVEFGNVYGTQNVFIGVDEKIFAKLLRRGDSLPSAILEKAILVQTATVALPEGQDAGIFPSAVQLRRALAHYERALTLRSANHTRTRTSDPLIELDAQLTNQDTGLLGKVISALPVTTADMILLVE
ncbi:hypothetical protein B0H13DRAFT_1890363, partial [Mycena leptocephala]